MIDDLKLSDETATAIIALGIEFETYSDEMPETEKDRLEAAHETVTFAIDAYKNDGFRSDAKDKEMAEIGEQVEAILAAAGVSIDEDDDIEYGKALTGKKLQKVLDAYDLEVTEEEPEGDGEGEAAFDIDDIIDGYEELSPAARIKAIKKLKLDPEDDDDVETLNDLADWEEEQDKPASRVLAYVEELLGEEEDGDGDEDSKGDEDGDEPETYTKKELLALDKEDLKKVAAEFEVEFPKRLTETGRKRTVEAIIAAQEEDGGDGDEPEEPFEGYDDATTKAIKAAIEESAEDEDEPLTVEEVENVIAYEKANENRAALLKWLDAFLEGMQEEEEPEEEKPKVRGRRGRRGAKAADPDDSSDVDDAVAGDDEKESRRGRRSTKKKAEDNGLVITITREQILTALDSGEVTIEVA